MVKSQSSLALSSTDNMCIYTKEQLNEQEHLHLKQHHPNDKYIYNRTSQRQVLETIKDILNAHLTLEYMLLERIYYFVLNIPWIGLSWLQRNQQKVVFLNNNDNYTTIMHSDYYSVHTHDLMEQSEIKNDTDWGYFVYFQ